jgi:hypothetical protein
LFEIPCSLVRFESFLAQAQYFTLSEAISKLLWQNKM